MKSILLSLTIIVFLAGCASTTQPAQVIGNKITNPTVGFNGYESTIPDGFHILEDDEEVSQELKHFYRQQGYADTFARGGGYLRDLIIFENEVKGMTIFIRVTELNLPGSLSQLSNFMHREAAAKIIGNISGNIEAKFTTHEDLEIPYAIEYSGHTRNEEKPVQVSGFMKIGKLNELIHVIGLTEKGDPEALEAIIKQMFTDTIIY